MEPEWKRAYRCKACQHVDGYVTKRSVCPKCGHVGFEPIVARFHAKYKGFRFFLAWFSTSNPFDGEWEIKDGVS